MNLLNPNCIYAVCACFFAGFFGFFAFYFTGKKPNYA